MRCCVWLRYKIKGAPFTSTPWCGEASGVAKKPLADPTSGECLRCGIPAHMDRNFTSAWLHKPAVILDRDELHLICVNAEQHLTYDGWLPEYKPPFANRQMRGGRIPVGRLHPLRTNLEAWSYRTLAKEVFGEGGLVGGGWTALDGKRWYSKEARSASPKGSYCYGCRRIGDLEVSESSF